MTLEQLARLMFGLQLSTGHNNPSKDSRRTYASAGGRYPIEAYILPLRVNTLPQHVFHYHVRSHSLEQLWSFSKQNFSDCFPNDEWCGDAAAAIILTASHNRSSIKYGDRAYRFCLLEAGAISQNIQLLCANEQLVCCSYGGYVEEAIMRLIDVEPSEELVMHVMFVGSSNNKAT
jgi:SagB-type dehydrogenase family enzyme